MAMLTRAKLESMHDLFERQLCSMLDAEHRQLDLFPKLVEAATDPQLGMALQDHCELTRSQFEVLEQVSVAEGLPLRRNPCQAMEGLIADAMVAARAQGCENVRDAHLVVATQAIEHYEISIYGSLRTFAQQLGQVGLQHLLQRFLDEEAGHDAKLTELAESFINTHAAREG